MKFTRAYFSVSGLYAFGLVFSILANVLLARLLSVEDFGFYSFAIAIATLVAIPVSVGLPLLLTREVSQAVQACDTLGIWRMLAVAGAWVLMAGWLAALGLQAAMLMGAISSQLAGLLGIAGFLPLAMGIVALAGGTLKGLGLPIYSEVLSQVIVPGGLVASLAVLHMLSLVNTGSAMAAYLTSYAAAALAGLALVVRKLPWTTFCLGVALERTKWSQVRAWGTAFLSFTLIGAMATLCTQIATLLLGWLGQPEELAYLRVAERGAQLVAFPLMFVNAVIGPYIVRAREDGPQALRALARHSARVSTLTAIPVALFIFLFGHPLIETTFGAPYAEMAYGPMMIMSAAQVLSMALGSGGMFLAMCGFEKTNVAVLLSSVLGTFAGVLCLAPEFGATGAAIGVLVGLIVAKVAAALMCRAQLGFLPTL